MIGHQTMGMESTATVRELVSGLRKQLSACMQCGTCTGSCASSAAMDLTPRQIWRLVQLGAIHEVLESRSFWLCASCYTCTLRCPRGLPLTEAMGALKHAALTLGAPGDRRSPLFYQAFMETVRRYGRVREMELMTRYFVSLGSPLQPLTFLPLGWKLLRRGKLPLQLPAFTATGRLDAIMEKVRELEAPKPVP